MPYRFDHQIILITGAGSGIGRATAVKLSSLGARLVLSDINESSLADTDAECGGGHYVVKLDVSDSDACKKHVEDVTSHHGQLNHVFNCAGINPTAYALEDTTDDYYDKLTNTNIRGVYNVTRAALPHLKAGSSIVNVSSVLGTKPAAQMAIYCATKYAVIGFSKAMALELGPTGIRVNAVAPGYIDTPTNAGVVAGPEAIKEQEVKISMGRMGTAAEVADVVAFLMSEEARYINGSVVEINGGLA